MTQPVQVVNNLAAGTKAIQYVKIGSGVGDYFTVPGTAATNVGVADSWGGTLLRVPRNFQATGSGPVLQSTARKIGDTWTLPGTKIPTQGGSLQWIAPKGEFVGVP